MDSVPIPHPHITLMTMYRIATSLGSSSPTDRTPWPGLPGALALALVVDPSHSVLFKQPPASLLNGLASIR